MTSAKDFWNWFEKNSAKYFFLNQIESEEERERLLDDFLNKLHAYSPKLYFEIGGHPDETQDLIITAGGNLDYFSKVEELVSQTPKLQHWKVIAFKPPSQENFVIEYKGVKIDPSKAWFLPLEREDEPDMLGLRICTAGYAPSKENEFINAAYLALDSILGEKSTALNVQHVEVDDLPENPEEGGLMNLTELPEYITWKKSKAAKK
ncbi:hypothetical protein [Pseudochryseolinea flava]|uniref:DUF695 domain-containing protein n=1 Tax=Pseudochryseolinea flava TaxID=2059302 RepID=A0A364Y061_9BACT|nr:hypothetical protein [Pseudochryseolinea flava]RAV99276.1 hypothetical protein DQQ10_20505 [Pseudochryseolinea flava]